MVLLTLNPAHEALMQWWRPAEVVKEELVEATGIVPGMANLGNTCFANSVLQCLLNTPGWFNEAITAFRKHEGSGQSQKAALGRSFAQLAMEYDSSEGKALSRYKGLKSMKEAIGALDSRYAGCQQQDAYEFMGCLLEGLEESFGALYGDKTGPACPSAGVIRAICGITTHSTRHCHSCSGCLEVDRVTDTALRLPLLSTAAQFDPEIRAKEEELPVSVQELIDIQRQAEDIEGYDCDACRASSEKNGTEHVRSKITQRCGIVSASRDVMMVVLYRFGHALDSKGNFSPIKVKRQVACPSELKMENDKYKLFGVVSHIGENLTSGHYVAAVQSRRDGVWYECNDEKVTTLNLKQLYDGRAVTSVRPGADPYILFYHRDQAAVTTPEARVDSIPAPMPTAGAANAPTAAPLTAFQPHCQQPTVPTTAVVGEAAVAQGQGEEAVVAAMAVTAVAALLVSNVSAMTTEKLAEAEIRAATAAAGAAAAAESNDGALGEAMMKEDNDNAVEGGWELVSPDASAYWKLDIDAPMDSSSCSSPSADDATIVADTPLEEASDQVPEDTWTANADDGAPDTPSQSEISSNSSSSRSIISSSAEDATPKSGSCEADGEWQVVAAQYMEVKRAGGAGRRATRSRSTELLGTLLGGCCR